MTRPKIFIGSSAEGLNLANAIFQNLERDFEITIWNQGIFLPSKTVLGQLIQFLNKFNYAIFIFSPDDITKLREESKNSIRANVIFETGLFMGKLGHEKVFFVKPRNTELHIPSDLLGIISGEYDHLRSDGNLIAATFPFCESVRTAIEDLEKIQVASENPVISYEKLLTVLENYLKDKSYKSLTFDSIVKNVDSLLTENVLAEIIRLYPERIVRSKLKNGQGVRIREVKKIISASNLDFLVGKWINEHTVNGKTEQEELEIKEDGKYYIDNKHWFNIKSYNYNPEKNRLTFIKTAIRVKDNRKLRNVLTIESDEIISGMEGNHMIKYIRKK